MPWGQREPSSAPTKPPAQGAQVLQRGQGLCAAPRSCFPCCSAYVWRGTETLSLCQVEGTRRRNQGMPGRETWQAKAAPEPLEADGQLRNRNEMGVG